MVSLLNTNEEDAIRNVNNSVLIKQLSKDIEFAINHHFGYSESKAVRMKKLFMLRYGEMCRLEDVARVYNISSRETVRRWQAQLERDIKRSSKIQKFLKDFSTCSELFA